VLSNGERGRASWWRGPGVRERVEREQMGDRRVFQRGFRALYAGLGSVWGASALDAIGVAGASLGRRCALILGAG
jgi:hypothetical protein